MFLSEFLTLLNEKCLSYYLRCLQVLLNEELTSYGSSRRRLDRFVQTRSTRLKMSRADWLGRLYAQDFSFSVRVVLVGSVPAYAGPISITGVPADARLIATTTNNSNLGNEADICTAFNQVAGCLSGATLRYKANSAGDAPQTESPMDASYDTTFTGSIRRLDGGDNLLQRRSEPLHYVPQLLLDCERRTADSAQYLFSLNQVGLSPAWTARAQSRSQASGRACRGVSPTSRSGATSRMALPIRRRHRMEARRLR